MVAETPVQTQHRAAIDTGAGAGAGAGVGVRVTVAITFVWMRGGRHERQTTHYRMPLPAPAARELAVHGQEAAEELISVAMQRLERYSVGRMLAALLHPEVHREDLAVALGNALAELEAGIQRHTGTGWQMHGGFVAVRRGVAAGGQQVLGHGGPRHTCLLRAITDGQIGRLPDMH